MNRRQAWDYHRRDWWPAHTLPSHFETYTAKWLSWGAPIAGQSIINRTAEDMRERHHLHESKHPASCTCWQCEIARQQKLGLDPALPAGQHVVDEVVSEAQSIIDQQSWSTQVREATRAAKPRKSTRASRKSKSRSKKRKK